MIIDTTGGPAFPQDAMPAWSDLKPTHSGMTLRDYFAAKAMQSLVAMDHMADALVAQQAYELADAMLEAREAA